VKTDEIEFVTALVYYTLLLFGPVTLPLVLLLWNYDTIWVEIIRTIHTDCTILDTTIAIGIWYGIWSSLVLFAIYALSGLYYPLTISKWLTFIR